MKRGVFVVVGALLTSFVAAVTSSGSGVEAFPTTERIELQVTGRAGVPTDAVAAVLNVTATNPEDAGYATVWPCGSPLPEASNLNFTQGESIPNLVIARIGAGGKVCLQASAPTDLIADFAGYFPSGSDFTPTAVPTRVLDTRAGRPTFTVVAGGVVELQVGGRSGIPTDVSAVVMNVTVTNPAAPGFVTVWPCNAQRPDASNLNYETGRTIPNLVISAVAPDGRLCLYSYAPTELIADVSGYFAAGSDYVPLVPARLLDTRIPGSTADGSSGELGLVGADSTLRLPVRDRGGVTSDAAAVVMNVTVTGAQEPGYVTVHACGTPLPEASNLNYDGGQTIPNLVIARVDATGEVCLYAFGATDLLADVSGVFPAGSDFVPAASPLRLLDTRQIPAPAPAPAPTTAPPVTDPSPTTTPAPPSGCVNINTAGIDDLRTIVHIDVERAQQIVSLRAVQPFASVSDLTRVSGIGDARVADIIDQGVACV